MDYGTHAPSLSTHVPVVVHDGVQSVCYGDDSAVRELTADGFLDQVVCLKVHGCRGLVQNQHFGFPEQSTGQADQLLLSHTERTQNILMFSSPLHNSSYLGFTLMLTEFHTYAY